MDETMKAKKINAALGLLSAVALLLHVGYTDYAYLMFFYGPALKLLTAAPFMVLTCLHAVFGMSVMFLQSDGTRLSEYPRQNRATVLQRISAALIFPLLILHLNTYTLLRASAEGGQWLLFALLMLSQPLFYGVALAHVAVSATRAMVTLGWLGDRERQKRIDRIVCVLLAAVFAVSVYAVVKGELGMFAHAGGAS